MTFMFQLTSDQTAPLVPAGAVADILNNLPMGYRKGNREDPKHERHAEMTEWLGRPFDPEAFDLEETDLAVCRAPNRAEFR